MLYILDVELDGRRVIEYVIITNKVKIKVKVKLFLCLSTITLRCTMEVNIKLHIFLDLASVTSSHLHNVATLLQGKEFMEFIGYEAGCAQC